MQNYFPTYTDITEWNKKMYSSTGGTRAKNIYTNPVNEKEYFFKGSKKLPDGSFKYTTEFWSEIIASKIGQWLGFNILDYNIGYDENNEQQIGCLSKSMIDYAENNLSEGIEYLRGYDSKYNPETDENRYTFEFIQQALASFMLSNYKEHFVKMMVFDAIIGNSDRHQENWGFITKFKETIEEIEDVIKNKKSYWGKIIPSFKKTMAKSILMQKNADKASVLRSQHIVAQTDFSPIYDSGCCLGRELLNDKIELYLIDNQALNSYVLKGKSEIRWRAGNKPKHFDLLQELIKVYPQVFYEVKKCILNEFSKEKLEILVNNIDSNLPGKLENLKLSQNRKNLIVKLIPLRIEKFLSITQ